MRILFLSTRFPYPPNSGHFLRTYNTLKALSRYHEIYFICFAKQLVDEKHISIMRGLCKSVDVYYLKEDISRTWMIISLVVNIFSPLPFVAQKYYSAVVTNKIQEILSGADIQLVHVDLLPLARYVKRVGKAKILVEHNVEWLRVRRWAAVEKNVAIKVFMFFQCWKIRRFERKMLGGFDKIITVSDFDQCELKKLYPEGDFVTIPNGIDTSYFNSSVEFEQRNKNEIIWVGGFGEIYNRQSIEYFLERIWPFVLENEPKTLFKIIGASPSKKMLGAAEKNKNINLMGFVEDIRPHVSSATVYVAPIRSGSGTKLKILNALAMGIPVVTTSVGAEGIAVEDGNHIIIRDDAHGFAAAIVNLLRDDKKRRRLAEAGRRLVEEKYDWNVIFKSMYGVYREFES